jgi:predicted TIM-barrel fold metal-dependent hydrolase
MRPLWQGGFMRKEFEMSPDELKEMLEACKPTPVMFLSGGVPMGRSQQENANDAWERLGKKYGFDYMSIRPVAGKDMSFFTAECLDQVGA